MAANLLTRVWSFALWACQGSQCCVRAFPWERSFFFFFPLFLWRSHGLGCYVTLVSSECPQGIHPSLYPKDWQSSSCLCTSPHWLWPKASMWATSWLIIAVHCEICGDFQLCCPLRFQSSPLTPPLRGFSIVWKLLLLHDSLPRMGLHP